MTQNTAHNIPLNAPKEVTSILADDLSVHNFPSANDPLISSSDYSAPEIILFCAPPSLVNGFTALFCIASLVAATVGLAMSSLSHQEIFSLFFCIFSFLLAGCCVVLLHKWQFFGYCVVTTHRACIVIPTWRGFCPPGVLNAFHKPTLKVIQQKGSFEASRKEFWVSKKETHIALLEPRKGNINAGYAIVHGPKNTLNFGLIPDYSLLGVILTTMNEIGFRPREHFQIRTSLPVPSYWVYFKNIIIHVVISLLEISAYFVTMILASYTFHKDMFEYFAFLPRQQKATVVNRKFQRLGRE